MGVSEKDFFSNEDYLVKSNSILGAIWTKIHKFIE